MQLKKIVVLLLLLVFVFVAHSFKPMRRFKFVNNCDKTIWIGGFGVPLPSVTGWEMKANSEYNLNMNADTVAIRFWARTGCQFKDGKFVCATGDCGAPLNGFGV
jgi:hypothetical protein